MNIQKVTSGNCPICLESLGSAELPVAIMAHEEDIRGSHADPANPANPAELWQRLVNGKEKETTNKLHAAHVSCLMEWFVNAQSPTCPLDRQPVSMINGVALHTFQKNYLDRVKQLSTQLSDAVKRAVQIRIQIEEGGVDVQELQKNERDLITAIEKWLLPQSEIRLFQKNRETIVGEIARNGHLELLRMFLNSGPISAECRKAALVTAAGHNHLPLVREFLAGKNFEEKVSAEVRGAALGNAARFGHLSIVRELLGDGPIPIPEYGDALLGAVREDSDYLVIETLLRERDPNLPPQGEVFKEIVERGSLPIIALFLESGLFTSDGYVEAIETVYQETQSFEDRVKTLVAAGREKEAGWLGLPLKRLQERLREFELIFDTLLEKARGKSAAERGCVIKLAAEKGRLDIVNKMLQEGEISDDSRSAALYAAGRADRLDIVRALFENWIPRYQILVMTFGDAIIRGSEEIRGFLEDKIRQHYPLQDRSKRPSDGQNKGLLATREPHQEKKRHDL